MICPKQRTMSNLLTYFPNYTTTDSLFAKMAGLGAPWTEEIGKNMDVMYFSMYSGIKNASQFIKLHLLETGNADSETIAELLYMMFGQNWNRWWSAYQLEYNPIDNYNIKEIVDRTQGDTRQITDKIDYTSSVDGTQKNVSSTSDTINSTTESTSSTTINSNGTEELEHGEVIDGTQDTENFTHGFNSANPVATTSQNVVTSDTHSGTDKTTTTNDTTTNVTGHSTVTSTDIGTGSLDISNQTAREDETAQNRTDTDNLKEDINRSRTGNIGQNSYQDLITQEFELWRWNFYKQVFDDVDSCIALAVYSCL